MKKHLISFILAAVSGISLFSCNDSVEEVNNPPEILKDIAFDKNKGEYRIYIKENGSYEPFLVLTENKNGCLLLREYLLEPRPYNNAGEYASYYENSLIDSFLCEEYPEYFSDELNKLIPSTDIDIISRNAIDTHDTDMNSINRKFFLLSAHEVNGGSVCKMGLEEGEELKYFGNISNLIATYKNGEKDSWMLRTPALLDGSTVYGIDPTGSIGMGGINGPVGPYENAVRPAFYLPASTEIISDSSIVSGKDVFILEDCE